MRNGSVQASYIADDGRRYYATHTFETRVDAEGWLANERKLIELGDGRRRRVGRQPRRLRGSRFTSTPRNGSPTVI